MSLKSLLTYINSANNINSDCRPAYRFYPSSESTDIRGLSLSDNAMPGMLHYPGLIQVGLYFLQIVFRLNSVDHSLLSKRNRTCGLFSSTFLSLFSSIRFGVKYTVSSDYSEQQKTKQGYQRQNSPVLSSAVKCYS